MPKEVIAKNIACGRLASSPKVAIEVWLPAGSGPSPVIVLIHGWTGKAIGTEHYQVMADELCQAGYAVVMLDLPGHGQSEGDQAKFTLGQGVAAVKACLRSIRTAGWANANDVTLLGNSIGGSVAAIAAARVGPKVVRRLILTAPRTSFAGLKAGYFKTGDKRPCESLRISGQATNFGKLARLISVPTLIVHGRNDQYIPPTQSLAFQSQLATHVDRREVVIIEADHRIPRATTLPILQDFLKETQQ
jgi:pimeloyl-ACP methyl ester carboxylesterase